MNGALWRTFLALGIGLGFVIAAWAGPAKGEDRKLTKFTYMFPVNSVTQYHPYYIAQKLGYFAEEALDVKFQPVDGSSAVIQQLVAGNVDAAQVSAGAFLNAVARGRALKWIFTYQYTNVFTLVTPTASGISSIKDLKGKKVGISGLAGGEVPLLRAVFRAAGLDEMTDVQLVPVGAGTALTVNALATGQVDAYSSDIFDVAAIKAAGIDVKVILPDGARNYPTDGIIVRAQTLKDKETRNKIVGFVRAVAKGIVFAEANDGAAFKIASQIAPEEFEDKDLAKRAWEAAKALKTPPPELSGQPIGSHFVDGFRAYHNFLLHGEEKDGALPRPVDVNTILDSSLLNAVNNFDTQAIKKQANDY